LGASGDVTARRLWFAMATGPVAWATAVVGNAMLSDLACGPTVRIWLVAVALAMLAMDLGAGLVAWRTARAAPPLSDDPRHASHRSFLAHSAWLACALFGVAIAALAVPPVVLHDCR
jgi:hypothetical protein